MLVVGDLGHNYQITHCAKVVRLNANQNYTKSLVDLENRQKDHNSILNW